MMRFLVTVKNNLVKAYEFIKELDQIPWRNLQGEFYDDEKPRKTKIRRENKVKVEDLRPQREDPS